MIEKFGQLADGQDVHRIAISSGDLSARFLTWGAVMQDIRLAQNAPSLTLGLGTLEEYVNYSRYFGATAGRCANRINAARFSLDGQSYDIDPNFIGKHHLHGGSSGIGKKIWTISDSGSDFVTMSIRVPDGHMGYPGTLSIDATFRLDGAALDILYSATTDRPTLCNLAHHSYWILDRSGTILNHNLRVAADHFTPVSNEFIPTGEVAEVAGTHLDFRKNRPLKDGSLTALIDHNFCTAAQKTALRPVAWLESLESGVSMRVQTTEPGLQVYDSGPMDVPVLDLDERALGPHSGIALEPQVWPDAINHSGFPSAVLRPGETYEQHTRFEFEKR